MKHRHTMPLLSGVLMGAGLSLAGLTSPDSVQNLLDPLGHFDPKVGVALLVALLVSALGFRSLRAQYKPWYADRYEWPKERSLRAKWLVGSLFVGIGVGLTGLTPSAAIVRTPTLAPDALMFLVALVAGHLAYRRWGG